MTAQDLAGCRGHTILPHTADAGIEAHGPTFAAALEEAAAALSELTADVPARHGSPVVHVVHIAATDPAGLLVAWLNELIGLTDVHHAALLDTTVESVDPALSGLTARVRLVPFAAGARPRVQAKSATFHRMAATEDATGWHLRAYLDV